MRNAWRVLMGLVMSATLLPSAFAEEEAKALLERLMASPAVKAEAGFATKVLVPPGHFYDPLIIVPHGTGALVNDDGKEAKDKGSRLLSVEKNGSTKVLADAGKMLPVAGFDVAPDGFGDFGGQVFALSQPKVGQEGTMANYVIQRLNPKEDYTASVFCSLPPLDEKKLSGLGVDVRFGPAGSPFAGKFYALTALNHTIYQGTPDGKCTPFVTFDAERVGQPFGMAFAPDGKNIVVTVARGGIFAPTGSAIVRVTPDGKVEDKPLAESKTLLAGIDFAPEGFGTYWGQIFVTEVGSFEAPVPMTQTLTADGKVHRVTPEGKLELVATGFINPLGLRFIDSRAWVSDINGDYYFGKRELPDGFLVEITVQSTAASKASPAQQEIKKLTERLLAAPTVQAEKGFTAKVLIPPGQLYDPLWMLPQGESVWMNDDGGEEEGKGSRLLSLDAQGKISILAGIGKLLPVTGFDLAPKGFGAFAGQIFTLAQAESGTPGVTKNHVIQRVDPKNDYAATIVCTLKEVDEGKIAGIGADARFGPEGSPFAGKFYAATAQNNTIYQVTADSQCSPFITFDDQLGAPFAMAFSPDGKTMYVSVTRGGFFSPTGSAIVRVTPEGKVDGKPLVESKTPLTGMDVAPEGFGAFAGQLFVAEIGKVEAPVPMTQPLTADSKLHRVTADGKLEPVASGFINAAGVRFVGKKLWVTDINGDFIAGRRELPDGFVIEIQAQ